MWLILLEMLMALGLGIFIVWWTMFHRPQSPGDVPESAVATEPKPSSSTAPAEEGGQPPRP